MEGQADSPLAICVSLGIGLFLLYISLFTLTIPHRFLPYLRLALAPPAIFCFSYFGYGPYELPIRRLTPGTSTIAIYGIMRVIEHSVISLCDPTPPHWVIHTPTNGNRAVVALPSTFKGRCSYAFDLLTSLRGSSWFSRLDWNWIPSSLQSSSPTLSRRRFIAYNMKTFVINYVIFDFFDMLNKSKNWEINSHNPITSLPVTQQFIFSISVCAGIGLTLSMQYQITSCMFVMCGSNPGSWPPLFDSPFYSRSLREFWTIRWHAMFRRVFERLTYPFLYYSYKFGNPPNKRTIALLRPLLVFACSTLLHLLVMYRLALKDCRSSGPCYPFLDVSILKFFLSQPLGLLVESAFVVPFAEWLFPAYPPNPPRESNGHAETYFKKCVDDQAARDGRSSAHWKRDIITLLYAWGFLIWTGRWWSDQWARSGLLDDPVVPLSLLRGVLHGHWIV